jgi:hypothetical protein
MVALAGTAPTRISVMAMLRFPPNAQESNCLRLGLDQYLSGKGHPDSFIGSIVPTEMAEEANCDNNFRARLFVLAATGHPRLSASRSNITVSFFSFTLIPHKRNDYFLITSVFTRYISHLGVLIG